MFDLCLRGPMGDTTRLDTKRKILIPGEVYTENVNSARVSMVADGGFGTRRSEFPGLVAFCS